MVGFCNALVKLFGPAHAYVLPPVDESVSVLPTVIGELLVAVAVGNALSVIIALAGGDTHPTDGVTLTVYVIEPAVPIAIGFCTAEEKLLLPDQA